MEASEIREFKPMRKITMKMKKMKTTGKVNGKRGTESQRDRILTV